MLLPFGKKSAKKRKGDMGDTLVQEVTAMARESDVWRDRVIDGRHTLKELWTKGPRIFHGDHWWETRDNVRVMPPDGIRFATLNRSQGSTIATVAVMTEKPVSIRFEARETGDEGVYFVKPKTARIIRRNITSEMAGVFHVAATFEGHGVDIPEDEQLDGKQPISIDQYEVFTEKPALLLDGTPTVSPMFTEEDFFELNDQTAAEALQVVFDSLWDKASGDAVVQEHALNFSVVGTQPLAMQWDFDRNGFRFSNVDIMNTRPDPLATRIEDMEYFIFDQVMSLENAVRAYPDKKERLEAAAQRGMLKVDSRNDQMLGMRYTQTQFGRQMVVIRTYWQRGIEYPMGNPLDDSDPHQMEGVDRGMVEVVDGAVLRVDPETGEITPGPITPDSKEWPKINGIRQVEMLPQIGEIISEERCPYSDIPFLWTKNIPIINSPYGLGEPQRIADIQQFINELATVIVNHLRYYAFPQEFWPKSLLSEIQSAEGATHSHPGQQIGIDDSNFRDWMSNSKKHGFAVEPPPLPSQTVDVLKLWFEEHDKLSGFADVLQGRPPSADSSGRAIMQLQQTAKGPIGFKSKHLEHSMRRAGELLADMMVKYLPPWNWTRILSKYPQGVALQFRERAKSIRWDVTAEVVSGRGVAKQTEQDLATQRRSMTPPTISLKSYLERVDDDPEREERRLKEEMGVENSLTGVDNSVPLIGDASTVGSIEPTGGAAPPGGPVG